MSLSAQNSSAVGIVHCLLGECEHSTDNFVHRDLLSHSFTSMRCRLKYVSVAKKSIWNDSGENVDIFLPSGCIAVA